MLITLIILVLAAIFFMNGKIRSDLVALCALILLLVFQILTPEEALSGFSNPIVIMMIGLFVVGGAIFQTGLAKMISNKMLKLAGKSELRLFILLMAVTSAIGAFVSNTGTVALLLPIAVSLAASFHMNPSRLLMPIAFASSMGGMMTLIGTPPNLVIQNTLTEAGFQPLEFFSFLPVGLICVGVGTLVLIPLSKYFLSKSGTKEKQIAERSGCGISVGRPSFPDARSTPFPADWQNSRRSRHPQPLRPEHPRNKKDYRSPEPFFKNDQPANSPEYCFTAG